MLKKSKKTNKQTLLKNLKNKQTSHAKRKKSILKIKQTNLANRKLQKSNKQIMLIKKSKIQTNEPC